VSIFARSCNLFFGLRDLRCLIAADENHVAVNCVDLSVVLDPRKRDQQIFCKDLLFNYIEDILCVALVVSEDQSSLVTYL
jgi:hypothetical protein